MDDPRFLSLVGGLFLVGVLLIALRWTWGTGRNQHIPDPDDPVADGLLVEVARTPTEAAAQALRSRLTGAGIRATVGRGRAGHAGPAGYRLMVFRDDAGQAKLVLRAE